MRRIMMAILALLVLAPIVLARPARAGTTELRHWIAKLLESLDAGLTRADLHTLRIEIGTEIRLQALNGTNSFANLPDFGRRLAAADQAWTVLAGAPPCQVESGTMRMPADCRGLIEPMFRTLGVAVPDLAATPNAGALIQPMLQMVQQQAEAALKAIR